MRGPGCLRKAWRAALVLAATMPVAACALVGSGGSSDAGGGTHASSANQPSAASDGLNVAVKTKAGLGCYFNGMVFPSSITPGLTASDHPGTGPTHAGKTWDQSPAAFSAKYPDPMELDFTLTGTPGSTVVVTGLNVHVLSRKPQVKGVWFNIIGQCGEGPTTKRYSVFDLNRAYPYKAPLTQVPGTDPNSPMHYPYTLSQGDSLSLVVFVTAEHCDCTWDAVLSWVDGSASQSLTVDDKGRPFESTSTTGIKRNTWGLPGAFGPGWVKVTPPSPPPSLSLRT